MAAAKITSVSITSGTGVVTGNLYNIGDNLTITVTFDDVVDVTYTPVFGTPSLNVLVGDGTPASPDRIAAAYYSGGSGTNQLRFVYTVVAGDLDGNGLGIRDNSTQGLNDNAISLNGGSSIKNGTTNAILTYNDVAPNTFYKLDGVINKPGLALRTDSGPSSTDNISKVGFFDVTLDSDVASWKWSKDGGASWAAGSGTSFTLTSGVYTTGKVRVQQVDKAGNTSANTLYGAVTIDTTAPGTPSLVLRADTGSSSSDKITSDATVNVTLVSDIGSWRWSKDSGATWTTGSGTSFVLPEGRYVAGTVRVEQTDLAGNVNGTNGQNNAAITIDKTAAAPTFILRTDSGSSASDGISKVGTVDITLDSDNYSWRWSKDGGANWTTGSFTSFELAEGVYAAGAIKVEQTDKAGNVSTQAASAAAITIDKTATTPTWSIYSDTALNNAPSWVPNTGSGLYASIDPYGDYNTSNGRIDVALPSDVVTWRYSTDGGGSWTAGSGTSFTLAEGSYSASGILVEQTDKAGNVSDQWGHPTKGWVRIDKTVGAASFALGTDTGKSSTDGITSNGLVNVSLASDVAAWRYSTDGGTNWTTGSVGGSGSSGSFTLAEGVYAASSILIQQVDKAANVSTQTVNAAAITIDKTVAAPSFAVGSTSTGTVNVTLASDVASWRYSTNGTSYTAGSGTSFTLAAGTYAVGKVKVEQTDTAGNVSTQTASTAAIIIGAIAAPTFALRTDSGSSSTDKITNVGTVDVTLASNVASWRYSTNSGTSWTAGSGTSFTLAEATYATGTIKVEQTSTGGQVSKQTASTAAITIDKTAPNPNSFSLLSDTGSSSTDGITNNGTISVGVSATAVTWRYSTDGGTNWTTGSGSSFVLAEGTYAIGKVVIRQSDAAGNESTAAANTAAFVVDKTVATPTIALATDSGASSSDWISKTGTVNVTLVSDMITWRYSTNGGTSWSSGSGSSFTLSNGTYAAGAVKVEQTDTAGNVSTQSVSTTAITIDNSIVAPSLALRAVTGAARQAGLTNDGTVDVTLASDVASWQYSTNGGTNWTTGSGTSFTLAEGTYASGQVQVKQTDTAGNASTTASSTSAIAIDKTVAAPSFALRTDSGSSASDNISKFGTVDVTLASDVGSWRYSTDGGTNWTTGNATSFILPEGTYAAGAIKVEQTDWAGNVSSKATNAGTVKFDQTAAAPGFALRSDTGASSTDGYSKVGTVDVTLASDVASWRYSTDYGNSWTTGSGTSFTLAEGKYDAGAIKIEQTDTAGNVSAKGTNVAIVQIDKSVATPSYAFASDTGLSNTDKITSNGAVNVSLSSEVSSWRYTTNGGTSWTTGSGSSFTLAAGTYSAGSVKVEQTDLAGNVSTQTANSSALYVVSSAAAPTFGLRTDAGVSSSDKISKVGTMDVALSEYVASWKYSADGGATWSSSTVPSFTLAAGTYAPGSVLVYQTDLAGNTSLNASNADTITIDQSVAAPSWALRNVTGAARQVGLTNNGTVDVTAATDFVGGRYSTDGGATWTSIASPTFTLAEGTYAADSVKVEVTDRAGNVSTQTVNASIITVDKTVAAPSFALRTDSGSSASDNISKFGTVDVTLASDVGSWRYSTDGGTNWTTGNATSFILPEGTYAAGAIKVEQTDWAGNVSTKATNAGTVKFDQTAAAPSFALNSDTGASSTDGYSKVGTVDVTLASDVASWRYSTDYGNSWSTGSGTSFTLAEGKYGAGAIKIEQTDTAGNVSAKGTNAAIVQIDKSVAAPGYTFASDTGLSNTDGITSAGLVNVALSSEVSSWRYTTNGGTNWTTGSGGSFTLAAGTYSAGSVKVEQTDLAGNVSTQTANTSTLFVGANVAAPSFGLRTDAGASSSDKISNVGTMDVALSEYVASWKYSADGGATWSSSTGSSFTLGAGTYAAGTVLVYQTDLAGNTSLNASNADTITIDQTVAAPSWALRNVTGAARQAGLTNNGTVDVTAASDVVSARYSTDSGATWTAAASPTTFTLAEGTYLAGSIKVEVTDRAGNASTHAVNTSTMTVDQTAAAPSFALRNDSGSSASDNISKFGTVNVALASDVASWRYSTDGGTNWTAGNAASFILSEGTYAAGAIKVEQTDWAGNISSKGTNAGVVKVDQAAAAPSFALQADTGASSTDGYTNDNSVDVTLSGDVASWQYSSDYGNTWATGSGTSFTLADGRYGSGAVIVRQTDIAGNLSEGASNDTKLRIDTVVAKAKLALLTDSGASNSDAVTRFGSVKVSLPTEAASWRYSVDGGANWAIGSDAGFKLSEGQFAVGSIKVEVTDAVGNVSVGSNSKKMVVDNIALAPSFDLVAETRASSSARVVAVDLADDVASWVYSTDNGATWFNGSGAEFVLEAGTYRSGWIKVKQTDAAGNTSLTSTSSVNMTISNTGSANFAGRASDEVMYGGSARDVLYGAAGADTLDGRGGSDLYLIKSSAEHTVAEVQDTGTSGTDELRFTATTTASLKLFAGDTGLESIVIGTGEGEVANTSGTNSASVDAGQLAYGVSMMGNNGSNFLVGGSGNDTVFGNAGLDTLNGGEGNDTLNGGLGEDKLRGGAGSDSFVFNTALNAVSNMDSIADFVSGTDAINLSHAIFGGIAAGNLDAGAFYGAAGATAAQDATDRIIYNTTTGDIYYDADGSGGAAAVKFLTLLSSTLAAPRPVLAASDFVII